MVKLRNFAEQVVDYLYYCHGLTKPYQPNFIDLLNDLTFRQAVPEVILAKLHRLRIKGNKAAHGDKMDALTTCQMVREGYDLGRWLFLTYSTGEEASLPPFREPAPTSGDDGKKQLQREKKVVLEQYAALEAKYQQLLAEVEARRIPDPCPGRDIRAASLGQNGWGTGRRNAPAR